MQEQHVALLLSDAARQVQIADHLLCTTFPLVRDPKLLLSVAEHMRRALTDAAQAVVRQESDDRIVEKFLAREQQLEIANSQEAMQLLRDLQQTLQQHRESPTTFARTDRLVIAGEGFSVLKELNPEELKRWLQIVKHFVHSAHMRRQ